MQQLPVCKSVLKKLHVVNGHAGQSPEVDSSSVGINNKRSFLVVDSKEVHSKKNASQSVNKFLLLSVRHINKITL